MFTLRAIHSVNCENEYNTIMELSYNDKITLLRKTVNVN